MRLLLIDAIERFEVSIKPRLTSYLTNKMRVFLLFMVTNPTEHTFQSNDVYYLINFIHKG